MNIISPHLWLRISILGFAFLFFHFNLAYAETAYLVSYNQKNIYLFDTATSKLTSTIPLNDDGGFGIAINPSGTVAYISHLPSSGSTTAGGISIVGINNNSFLSKIAVGESGLVMNSQGTRLYAGSMSPKLYFIDTATNQIIKSFY